MAYFADRYITVANFLIFDWNGKRPHNASPEKLWQGTGIKYLWGGKSAADYTLVDCKLLPQSFSRLNLNIERRCQNKRPLHFLGYLGGRGWGVPKWSDHHHFFLLGNLCFFRCPGLHINSRVLWKQMFSTSLWWSFGELQYSFWHICATSIFFSRPGAFCVFLY